MISGASRGNYKSGKEAQSIKTLEKEYPRIREILLSQGVPFFGSEDQSLAYLCEEAGVDVQDLFSLLAGEEQNSKGTPLGAVESLTIHPGTDKDRKKEYHQAITLIPGEILALVGPTGSGKSLFLADIEGLVQGDSPSGRRIELNNQRVPEDLRFYQTGKPIAQISQTMNYLLDIPVGEFLEVHGESRGIKVGRSLKKEILAQACTLCGEKFTLDSSMIDLSGGQARALMISDALRISQAPVILVDEIENAGIHKERAIELLLKQSNITLMATHDPLIALLAHRRIVFKNGGIHRILKRSQEEDQLLAELRQREQWMQELRTFLRRGENLPSP